MGNVEPVFSSAAHEKEREKGNGQGSNGRVGGKWAVQHRRRERGAGGWWAGLIRFFVKESHRAQLLRRNRDIVGRRSGLQAFPL